MHWVGGRFAINVSARKKERRQHVPKAVRADAKHNKASTPGDWLSILSNALRMNESDYGSSCIPIDVDKQTVKKSRQHRYRLSRDYNSTKLDNQ